MKKFKRIMALVIAMAMVLGMTSMAAFADPPTTGTITINSPVVSATYKVYKIFDMETNEAVDAFSYTLKSDNPFYGAVVAYAADASKGLTLTRIAGSENPAIYNVAVDESKFKAQDFGKAMQAVLANGSPAVEADADKGIVAKAAGGAAIDATDSKVADVASSVQLEFTGLDLGYFLVNPTYPDASYGTVTMGTGTNAKTFTVDDLQKETEGENAGKVKDPLALTTDAESKITAYVESQIGSSYTDEKFTQYLTDKGITTNEDGTPLDDAGKQSYYNSLKTEMTNDAKEKVLAAFANKLDGSEADINVKEPILVFLDSSQPNAVINEKNELDKWDVPVNPEGDVKPGTPDHGEPDGGKNIVVQEDPQYFADWSEAEIGESVHYQLRVNAMNFIRTGTTDDTIEQVKEYFLADYQSGHMHFDTTKGLKVTVWQGNDNNNSQAGMTNVTKNAQGEHVDYLDYTTAASGTLPNAFFKNSTDADAKTGDYSETNSIFGEGTGIMVPWVKVSEKNPATPDSNYPVYTTTKVPTGQYRMPEQGEDTSQYVLDAQGYILDENNARIPIYDTYYVYSLYSSDVTIVVDYWMILDDDAIVDEPGNKNFAQYGWSPVDNEDGEGNPKKPENPNDNDNPSQKEKVDEATVYTFALAWVKVDNKANQLAGAEFTLPFYVKSTKDGDAYIYAGKDPADKTGLTNKVTTTATDSVITIKGVEQGTYSITETKAPDGYNKLPAPFDVEAKKSGDSVTTKTKTTIYLDAQGNITDEVTTTTKEYNTDEDSFNNSSATGTEEKTVPVYQFDYIENKKGTELPSTGGIGTTIFYVVGAILVIGAGVIMITRRRMDA